jgi:lantibiotic modifying enzyme
VAAGSPDSPDTNRLAASVADRLLELCLDGKRGGGHDFAHGDAGVGWALLRYAAEPSFAQDAGPHAAAGTALLRSALNAALRERDLGWYSGLSGVVLAAADALAPADRRTAAGGFNRFVRVLSGPSPMPDLSLRQGAAGLLEPLLALAGRGHGGARETLTRRVRGVLGTIEQQGHLCGTPDHVPTPGLLSGLSGIGHTLLRLGYPDQVPSLALFAPTVSESGRPVAARKPSAHPVVP